MNTKNDFMHDHKKQSDMITAFWDAIAGTADTLKDYGNGDFISRTQVHLLSFIYLNPGITATELATKKQRKKSTISQILSTLENKGYLYRVPDKNDAKKMRLYPTKEGEKLCRLHDSFDARIMAERYTKLLQTCTEEEISHFFKVMSAFNNIL